MPLNLTEPTGAAPGSKYLALSPLRRSRNDHREPLAEIPEVLPGPVVVAYDGTPEAAALVLMAAACVADGRVLIVHCWRSLNNSRDLAVALRSCVHPQSIRRVLEVAREHDAAARHEAERTVAAGVAVAQEAGAQASGMCAALRDGRAVADALYAVVNEVDPGGVFVGVRPRRGWRRLLRRWETARVLARRLHVPVISVPLGDEPEEVLYGSCQSSSAWDPERGAGAQQAPRRHRRAGVLADRHARVDRA